MSDTLPHVQFEMTPERRERFQRVSFEIMNILEKEMKPLESIALLDLLREGISQQYSFGAYKGTHLISSQRGKESICPGCEVKLNAYADPGGHTAGPGDVTVCSQCGEILIFSDEMAMERPNLIQRAAICTDGRVMGMVAAIQCARKEREELLARAEKHTDTEGAA